ncbi:MAG TPA: murein biosynthesis integral membrane protein MurJ, partial [Solirubrobacterales bacterium]|nr:murein biosynthesis integral membrane protein MurJ [Solirubrobacterales bacterium]
METPRAPDTPNPDERPINADAVWEAEAFEPGEELTRDPAPGKQPGRIARSTAFFSIATAASRVAGLAREVVAAGYYGISGPMSAFTVAFQVPNLIRALFADAALQPAFVPVFTELLGKKAYKEAFRLASTMLLLVTMVLGAITALFVLLAPVIMPLFAPGFEGEILDLTVALSQVLFPILVLLGISGIVVGILNSYDRFGAFAISPLFWNLTIILVLVVLEPLFEGQDRIYAYAIGILVGTAVQLLIPAWDLRHTPYRFSFSFDWRNPKVRRVLVLMLPVTISLGLINFNLLINSFFGSLVSEQAPAAIDKAFRIYQLPQGIFSVAIATVLFPTLARFANAGEIDSLRATMANGMRQILFVLVPAAAAMLVLADPMIRLIYQRGAFEAHETEVVATALFWFAFSLPTNGLFLLLTRTFFSLQRPWVPTGIAAANLAVTAGAALALYHLGVGGIVASTAIATGV